MKYTINLTDKEFRFIKMVTDTNLKNDSKIIDAYFRCLLNSQMRNYEEHYSNYNFFNR